MLLPLAFCRECGQEYLVVWRRHRDGAVIYQARRDAADRRRTDEDGRRRRLPLRLRDLPWPRDLETVIADRRAARVLAGGRRPHRPGRRPADAPASTSRMPVTVDVFGHERPAGGGIEAAFIPGPFRFCLRCGVSYEQVRGSDFAKLATLDQEGRSSATTLISMSIVRSPAGRPGRRPGRRRPQAAHLRRQPAGRGAAGRALQRLRPGDDGPRRAVPGRA